MRILLALFFAALVGCGSGTPSSDGGGGAGDMSGGPSSGCSTARDCRLFSSYCVSAPCQCFAVGAHDVDPPCVAGTQTCIVDPCLNKMAACTNGTCTIAP